MRIIAGIAKGRKLKMVKGLSIRPMLDRIKESIFGIISADIIDADVLDLYAGSGSMCLEAISRGARRGVLVDKSIISCNVAKENAIITGFSDMIEIIRKDVCETIKFLDKKTYKFKFVFSDPPYNNNLSEKTLQCLSKSNIIDNSSTIIARYHKNESVSDNVGDLKLFDRRFYGDAIVSFYRKGV